MLGLPYNLFRKKGKFMCAKTQTLTSGLEDYLEEIYIAHLNDTPLKGAELARKLNISRASVSEALSKLVTVKNKVLRDGEETVIDSSVKSSTL